MAYFRSRARRNQSWKTSPVASANGTTAASNGAYPLEDVEEDKVSAAFKNGVLTITVPKSAEAKNVRRIAINRND